MVLVDSHCHLDLIQRSLEEEELAEVLAAAHHEGVRHIVTVSTNMEGFAERLTIASQFTGVSTSVGVHPVDQGIEDPSVERLVEYGQHDKVIAVGETGLDYYHCKGDVTWQQERFIRHIEAAKILEKPLIIHSRDAWDDTLRILKVHRADLVGGVLHCFSGSMEIAAIGIDLGFLISFAGPVTFKNAVDLQIVARDLPLESMLVETDAPYLTPVPYRGKPNRPGYVRHVAEKIAELKETDLKTVAAQTTKNFCQKFRVDV